MSVPDLVKALRRMRVQTGSLVCLGCGYEHNCGINGCAVIRKTVDTIEVLAAELDAMLEELRRYEDCDTCAHAKVLCDCPDDAYGCSDCIYRNLRSDCYCKDCDSGSKWEWRGQRKEVMQNDEPRS